MLMATPKKLTVSEAALVARCQRRLSKEGKKLVKDRVKNWGWFIVDERTNSARSMSDLEEFARKLGVLKPWERMAR